MPRGVMRIIQAAQNTHSDVGMVRKSSMTVGERTGGPLVAVAFTKLCAQAKRQMHAFELIRPVLHRVGKLSPRDGGAREGTGSAKHFAGLGAKTRERLVAEHGDEIKVLVHEDRNGHASPAAHFDLLSEIRVHISVNEAETDKPVATGVCQVIENRALLNAVAAPDA